MANSIPAKNDHGNGFNSKTRICLATMAPYVGGAEVAAERLGIGLKQEGHSVFLLLGRPGAVKDRLETIGLRNVVSPMYHTDKWHWFRYWRARQAIRRILKRERPDVIHSNDLPTHQIMSDAARGLGIPRICHHRFPFSGETIDWLNKYGCERHLFVSRALMDEMCAESQKLRGAIRAVVHDGLPLAELPDDNQRLQARRDLAIPEGKTLVIIAGQVIERKGVADLINAWALLDRATAGRAHLVVVGDDLAGQGAYRREMEQLAIQQRISVGFVGFQKQVDQWLQAADIAVVPSHVEPLGNATLEAMSFGLPVIGSRVGGIPEMVVHEETGLLVEPKNPQNLRHALDRLINDVGLRQQLGAAGRARCEKHFSLASHTTAVLKEYDQVRQPCGPPSN